jgi:hypothetical protein
MQADTLTTAPIEIDPEFVTIPCAQARWPVSRTRIYEAIAKHEVESVCLRKPGKLRGRRLLRVASMRRWLAGMPTGIDERLSKHCRRAGKASQAKRREKAKQPVKKTNSNLLHSEQSAPETSGTQAPKQNSRVTQTKKEKNND